MEKNLAAELTFIEAEKKKLRAQMLSSSHLIDWDITSEEVLKNLRKHISQFPRTTVIGGYWPIKGEINVLSFLEEWCSQGGIACLPFIADFKLPLVFYPWTLETEMEIGRYKILTPKQRKNSVFPDIVLTPLLAFDDKGHRLGRSGGFYDRTLRELRQQKNIHAIGLGSEHQHVFALPFDSHDEKLDYVITDKETFNFQTQ